MEVDCEYNRLGDNEHCGCPRETIVAPTMKSENSIYPDIVVHQREYSQYLLAIEVRKASNSSAAGHDQHKLRALTIRICGSPTRIGVLFAPWQEEASRTSEGYMSRRTDRPCRTGWPDA